MNLETINKIYLIGIGGIGMSALARYFNAEGKMVCGYDKTQTQLCLQLEAEGIQIHYEDKINQIPFYQEIENGTRIHDHLLVIYTPAIPTSHQELNYLKEKGFYLKKRSEILGLLTKDKFTIAVAGTHGKTTTSSMIAHLLKHSQIPCIAFLGGISNNYHSNLILPSKSDFKKALVVAEADEYDRSFLTLHPDISIITSMDADHLDIYESAANMEESYNQFASLLNASGKLIVKSGLPINFPHATYSTHEYSDYRAKNIRIENHQYVFDLHSNEGNILNISVGLPGRHNVENAVAAIAVGLHLKISEDNIRSAFATYSGVKRRFEKIIDTDTLTYIDDYAHHPEEIRALVSSIKEMYPGKKITGIFQPHLFSRTRDFLDGFVESLSLLNELILLDIYPAREAPIEGISSKLILDNLNSECKAIILSKEETLEKLKKNRPEVLLTIGAGDIDTLISPIRMVLNNQIKEISS